MKKKPIIIIVLVLAVIAIPVLINLTKEKPVEELKVEITRGKFDITVKTTGELQAENSEKIQGPSLRKIGIWRVKIADLVPEGTLVDSGEYVGELDRSEITSKLDEVGEQLQKVQSQFEKTQLDTALEMRQLRDNLINLKYAMEEAQITLDESKYESPATIRQATINLEKAGRAYSQALENYDIKKEQNKARILEVAITLNQQERRMRDILEVQDQFTIYAPKSGMVIYQKEWGGQKRKVGSEIDNWDPTIATLPDMSSMMSRTYVNEIDISKISKGQEVVVQIDAFPDKKYSGIVKEVANVGENLPNSDAKVFEVMIKINGTDTILKPSMTSSNEILVAGYTDVLIAPLEAIHNNDSLTFVYLNQPFSVVKQIVEVGESNENKIMILQGVKEKDLVLLSIPENAAQLKFSGLEIYNDIRKKREEKRIELERRNQEMADTLKERKNRKEKMLQSPKSSEIKIMQSVEKQGNRSGKPRRNQ
jgi:HlyD family secretion protein